MDGESETLSAWVDGTMIDQLMTINSVFACVYVHVYVH